MAAAYAAEGSGDLELRRLTDHEGDSDLILIEGSARSLRLLSDLLAAVANSRALDASFQMGPRHAGSFHFSESSKFGLYINRREVPEPD